MTYTTTIFNLPNILLVHIISLRWALRWARCELFSFYTPILHQLVSSSPMFHFRPHCSTTICPLISHNFTGTITSRNGLAPPMEIQGSSDASAQASIRFGSILEDWERGLGSLIPPWRGTVS